MRFLTPSSAGAPVHLRKSASICGWDFSLPPTTTLGPYFRVHSCPFVVPSPPLFCGSEAAQSRERIRFLELGRVLLLLAGVEIHHLGIQIEFDLVKSVDGFLDRFSQIFLTIDRLAVHAFYCHVIQLRITNGVVAWQDLAQENDLTRLWKKVRLVMIEIDKPLGRFPLPGGTPFSQVLATKLFKHQPTQDQVARGAADDVG